MIMEENKNNTQKQPEQKKKKKSDVLLTIALIVAIAVFCYAAFNLYHIYTEYKKGTDEYNQIEEMAVTERDADSAEVAGPSAQIKPPIEVIGVFSSWETFAIKLRRIDSSWESDCAILLSAIAS